VNQGRVTRDGCRALSIPDRRSDLPVAGQGPQRRLHPQGCFFCTCEDA
jgi:hypothetical protein